MLQAAQAARQTSHANPRRDPPLPRASLLTDDKESPRERREVDAVEFAHVIANVSRRSTDGLPSSAVAYTPPLLATDSTRTERGQIFS